MKKKSKILVITTALILVLTITILSFHLSQSLEYIITGKVTARAYILETVPEQCNVTLKQGINTVSFFCEAGRPIEQALSDNQSVFDYKAIYRYDTLNPQNPWRINNPELPEYITPGFTDIRRREGYIIVMNEERTYDYTGFLSQNTNIELKKGWNLVGYVLRENRSVENFVDGNISRIETYDPINSEWITYEPGGVNELQYFEPMKAYWIKAKEDVTLNIN